MILKLQVTLLFKKQELYRKIEYQNLQIKLGGKIDGEIKVSDKIKNISDSQKKKIILQLNHYKTEFHLQNKLFYFT